MPVWTASMELVEAFYFATNSFPREEVFGLSAQIRRAAVSVPANIAEGAARGSTAELIQYLRIANGSLSELDTHLELAVRLGYLSDGSNLQSKLDHVQSQILLIISSLKRRSR